MAIIHSSTSNSPVMSGPLKEEGLARLLLLSSAPNPPRICTLYSVNHTAVRVGCHFGWHVSTVFGYSELVHCILVSFYVLVPSLVWGLVYYFGLGPTLKPRCLISYFEITFCFANKSSSYMYSFVSFHFLRAWEWWRCPLFMLGPGSPRRDATAQ